MNTLRLFPQELRRLLQSRLTGLTVLLTVLSPLVGLVLYRPADADTMLSVYLANPALAGGAAGGILFGLLAVYEWDRAARCRADSVSRFGEPGQRPAMGHIRSVVFRPERTRNIHSNIHKHENGLSENQGTARSVK